jgi:hypothetical protein
MVPVPLGSPSTTRREVTLMRIALTIDASWPLDFA